MDQVERYLRTTITQLELLQVEGPAARERLGEVRRDHAQRQPSAPKGGRAPSDQALWGDLVDAAFVRSARKLGYNPAELWYVRDRMSKVSGHLLASEMHASSENTAALFRQQAESMRGTPGVEKTQIDAMLQAAARAEQQQPAPAAPSRVAQNLDVLRRTRGGLSETSWRRIAGVAAGIGLSDLAQLSEAEAGRRLGELRTLHSHALENREPPPG